MKMTRRQTKWAIWYETTYWKGGHHRVYQTKSLTEYHDMLHDRAKAGGYKAETYRYERFSGWPGLASFLIKTTKSEAPTKKFPACARVNKSMVR